MKVIVTPAGSVTSANGSVPSGARFDPSEIVTSTFCEAVRPAGSRAVAVTVALPAAIPVIVNVEPDTDAVATETSELSAA